MRLSPPVTRRIGDRTRCCPSRVFPTRENPLPHHLAVPCAGRVCGLRMHGGRTGSRTEPSRSPNHGGARHFAARCVTRADFRPRPGLRTSAPPGSPSLRARPVVRVWPGIRCRALRHNSALDAPSLGRLRPFTRRAGAVLPAWRAETNRLPHSPAGSGAPDRERHTQAVNAAGSPRLRAADPAPALARRLDRHRICAAPPPIARTGAKRRNRMSQSGRAAFHRMRADPSAGGICAGSVPIRVQPDRVCPRTAFGTPRGSIPGSGVEAPIVQKSPAGGACPRPEGWTASAQQ